MTLGGLAAAVGLIVDDAIVMLEHIMRRLHGSSRHFHERITTAPLGNSLGHCSARPRSTIIIFAPLAFLSGVTGAFFKALSLTMAVSLAISFCIAWLGLPVLAQAMLRPVDVTACARAARGSPHSTPQSCGSCCRDRGSCCWRSAARWPRVGSAIRTPALASCRRWTKGDSFSITAPLAGTSLDRNGPHASRSGRNPPQYARSANVFAPHRPAIGRWT